MFWMSRFSRHAGLMSRMAATLGIDFAETVQRGGADAREFRALAVNCTGCLRPEACEHWLQANAGGADEAPGYCRNKSSFDRMVKAR